MPEYSFCETVTASGLTRWHIRELTKAGRKLGGGADTPSLCGREVAWDVGVEISAHHLAHGCRKCAEKFAEVNHA